MSKENEIKSRFGTAQNSAENAVTARPVKTEAQNSLFDAVKTDGLRWNKLYPYQLIVVEKTANGWSTDLNWRFTLPIPPQQLEIDMPFAITASATLGGIIEEHNGAPFRTISFSGTTGVLPLKGAPDTVPQFNVPESIFAGTVVAAAITGNDLNRGFNLTQANNVVSSEVFKSDTNAINRTSGYYQYHLLKEFLETYAERKKNKANANLRLAFAMWKDNSVFLVTPLTFKTSRGADSPSEYRYQIALKAWARITLLGNQPGPEEHPPHGRDPSKIANILSKISALRGILENSRKIMQAIRGDINSALFTPLREISLSLKAISGVSRSLADLGPNIIADCKESLLSENMSEVRTALESAGLTINSNTDNVPAVKTAALERLAIESGKASVKGGQTPYTSTVLSGSAPANAFFKSPDDNYDLFSKFNPDSLKLPPKVQADIRKETDRCKNLSRSDFEERRNSINSVLEDITESIGLGSDTYNRTYNIKPKNSIAKTLTEDDIDIVYSLNALLMEVNKLCVSNKMDPNKTDAIQYIAGLASRSGIAFTEPASKFLVPFPYQHTIEEVAGLYLGDVERWYEIAALNGLKAPYVDEIGFDVLLTTNAVGNTIQVADKTNLFVGQSVSISSYGIPNETRRITGINTIASDVHLVTLSGEPDLNRFTVVNQSKIHAYLPDTVNSRMSIYIPSSQDLNDEDFQVKKIQGIDYFDNLVRVGGISLLLTSSNDIAIGPDGRSGFAAGLTNIVQKARIALSTPKGSLFRHPSYGLPVQPGDSTADVTAKEILDSIRDMFAKDPSFSEITGASVVKNGPTSRVTVNIGIAGTSQNIPITTEIRR